MNSIDLFKNVMLLFWKKLYNLLSILCKPTIGYFVIVMKWLSNSIYIIIAVAY